MKKIITTILLSTLLMVGYSQNTKSKLISAIVDEFTDEVSYFSNGAIFYADYGDMKTEGMVMEFFLESSYGKLSSGTIYLKISGPKDCIGEGSTLIVIFENGKKTTLINWKDFNCEGINYFSLSGKEYLFKYNKIKAIKYVNKRTYKSMVVKNNINASNNSSIMNLLLEIDKINKGVLTVK
jgi:hypothetical protein|tara:strand:+ start:652 stop:1194 length:543 start_codon:yes stop_codon:yes gene_type:complete